MCKKERARLIERHIATNGLVVLDPMPLPTRVDWAKRWASEKTRAGGMAHLRKYHGVL